MRKRRRKRRWQEEVQYKIRRRGGTRAERANRRENIQIFRRKRADNRGEDKLKQWLSLLATDVVKIKINTALGMGIKPNYCYLSWLYHGTNTENTLGVCVKVYKL